MIIIIVISLFLLLFIVVIISMIQQHVHYPPSCFLRSTRIFHDLPPETGEVVAPA